MMAPRPTDAPSLRLDGRLAVITGASEGIGRAFALAFAAAGARVILFSRRADALEEVCAQIMAEGGTADCVAGDVTSADDLDRLADLVNSLAAHSGSLVLVNNAGFGFTRAALDTREEDWDKLFDTHVKGAFFTSRRIVPAMIARGYGKIINMSSTWSASSDTGKVAYGAAKSAVSHMTAGLSTEWAPHGIRVNALAPTTTMTAFTRRTMDAQPDRAARLLAKIKLGRYAEPEDLIGPALFLAGAASDFVTGQTLFVDGGWQAAS